MFMVKVNFENLDFARKLLDCYKEISYEQRFFNGERYLVVNPTNDSTDFVLSEMAFEMNWRQSGVKLCPLCTAVIEKTGIGYSTCGHLVFTNPIVGRF